MWEASRLLKQSVLDFFNVACERRDFRGAPEINRPRHSHGRSILPGHPWPDINRIVEKAFFNILSGGRPVLRLQQCTP
jgi:hypothetical protein